MTLKLVLCLRITGTNPMNDLVLDWDQWDADAFRGCVLYIACEVSFFISVGM
jgi:hypothetical protein